MNSIAGLKAYEQCYAIVSNRKDGWRPCGLYSKDFGVIKDGLFDWPAWKANGRATPLDFAKTHNVVDGDFIFGGLVYEHFGHLLLETFCRLHVFFETDFQILFLDTTNGRHARFWEIVDAFQLPKDRITVVDQNSIIRKLLVTPRGFTVKKNIDKNNVRYFEKLASSLGFQENVDEKPIYLSRAKTRKNGRYYFGETVLQTILENKNFDIVYLEDMPVREQIGMMLSKKNICGFTGSAFHHLIYCQESKNVFYFDIFPIHENFQLVESTKTNKTKYTTIKNFTSAKNILEKYKFIDINKINGPFLLNQQSILEFCNAMGIELNESDLDQEYLNQETKSFYENLIYLAADEIGKTLQHNRISENAAVQALRTISNDLQPV